ncbi:MAG: DUF1289 domain-containing protein [Pseudomonadota bacterium]
MNPVESPCTNICTIDGATGFCRGCGRTIVEITEWASASHQRQQAIIDLLPARMDALHASDDGKT